MNQLLKLGILVSCLIILLVKGLIIGLAWPEAIVACVLISGSLYEKFLKTSLETKELEKEKAITELKIKSLEDVQELREKVNSLEGKMAIAGIVRRK